MTIFTIKMLGNYRLPSDETIKNVVSVDIGVISREAETATFEVDMPQKLTADIIVSSLAGYFRDRAEVSKN